MGQETRREKPADDPLATSAEAAASIGDRAENGEGDEAQPELFPIGSIEGDGVTLKSLVKPGMKVEYTVSLMSGEVPASSGGMLDPAREGMLLVTHEPAKLDAVPQREGDRGDKKVVGYKIRQNVRPVYIEQVHGEAGAIEAQFAELLAAKPKDAGALLDRLQARMTTAVGD